MRRKPGTDPLFILFFFLLCISQLKVSAQQSNYLNYGVQDGLPQSTVFDIYQDHRGYLWIGTDGGGLSRYDGFRFRNYGRNDGLEANVIRKITADSSKILWLATNAGIYTFDQKIRSFDLIRDNRSIYFTSVFTDSRNNIWASTMGRGVMMISRTAGSYSVTNFNTDNILSSNYIFDVCEDGRGRIWIASFGKGIDIYDPVTHHVTAFPQAGPAENEVVSLKKISGSEIVFGTKAAGAYIVNTDSSVSAARHISITGKSMVWSVGISDDNALWIATDNAGVLNTGSGFRLHMGNGLPGNRIFKVFTDREKNLWIGTAESGLSRYLGKRFTHITSRELPALTQVSAIYEEPEGDIWLGTSQSGLYRISYQDEKISILGHITIKDGLPSDEITGISADPQGGIWIGTRKGICHLNGRTFTSFTEAKGLVNDHVNCLLRDSRDRLWIGTLGGLSMREAGGSFSNMSESNGLINNEIQCFYEDVRGNIWIGTFGGLVKYDGEKLYSYFEEDGLLEKRVQSLTGDRQGNIYIGTFGGGIYKYHVAEKEKQPIRQFCNDSVLLSNNIYSLKFENDTSLIAGTNLGLNKIYIGPAGNARGIYSATSNDGFRNLETSINAIHKRKDGSVWIGTTKGLTVYQPRYESYQRQKPEVHVINVFINGQRQQGSNRYNLSYDQNSVKVSWLAISLTNPSENIYYARLTGIDNKWNRLPVDKGNTEDFISVEYKKLQPGRYRLLLKAVNSEGVESDTVRITFNIGEPFYKSPWFIIACILLFILLVYYYFRLREKKLIQDRDKLERIVTERTAEVVESKKQIEEQNHLLQVQKHEITDSINYAKRIQLAILPEMELLSEVFPQSFILYQPKDIVSGDFFFFEKGADGEFHLGVADCTGHGVPGAFMSMIGSKELAQAVKEKNEPSGILMTLNKGMRATLKQDAATGIRDGMDIGFVTFRRTQQDIMKMLYAGANRPLWLLRKDADEISEIKATKTAIGGFTPAEQVFEQHEITLMKGDMIYLFSDGFADQFGGPLGKKMMTKRFRELLMECRHQSMPQQKQFLLEFFESWKGADNEQVDDLQVVGIRI